MPENPSLTAFLADGASTSAPPAQPPTEPPAPTTPPAESKAPSPSPAPAAKTPEAKPEAKPEDDDHDLPVTGGDNRTVPFSALEKVRNDWKSKYAAEQARAELLAKQLEDAKRPPPAPPPPAPVMQPPPDFHSDPQGYIQHVQMQNQQILLNERLNMSEAMLRDKIGDEKVTEYVNEFRQFASKDPTLWPKLYQQPTPYQWLTKEIDRLRLHSEIGDDPSAYRAKLLAEERAKWEAERAQAAPVVSPAANLPPSLATARSVAGRTAPAWTGEPSLEDVVRGIPSHMRAQRGRS